MNTRTICIQEQIWMSTITSGNIEQLQQENERLIEILRQNNISLDDVDLSIGDVESVVTSSGDVDWGNRKRLINEIIETERDYVNDLEIIINVFYQPLQNLGIISEKDQQILFANVEELYLLNKNKVLSRFEEIYDEAIQNNVPVSHIAVGDVFLELSDHLKTYTDYCANQPDSLALLEYMSVDNDEFEKFTSNLMNNEPLVRGLSLLSFIIKPIQRLCKYPLLLRELIKLTPPTDDDYLKIQSAVEAVNVTVGFVNEMQREAEIKKHAQLEEISAIGDSIEGGEVLGLMDDKTRILIRQGEIFRVVKKKITPRYIWMFSNLVVVAIPLKKVKKGKKNPNVMVEYKLDFFIDVKNVALTDTSDDEYASNLFLVKDRSNPTFETATLSCETLDAKNSWLKVIKNAFKVFQRQELAKRKAELETGKEKSVALSVHAESTSVAFKKFTASGSPILQRKKVLTTDSEDQNMPIFKRNNAALPFLSPEFAQECLDLILSDYKEFPFYQKDFPAPPPPDNQTWSRPTPTKQIQDMMWKEWVLFNTDDGREYYYNTKTKEITWEHPSLLVNGFRPRKRATSKVSKTVRI